jgi:hypothetical protein
MKNKKKLILGLAVGTAAFAAVFAMAASLAVGSNSLGAGNADVASCDTDGVAHSYTTSFAQGLPGYKVDTIEVTGIAAACDGYDIKATVMNTADAALTSETGTIAPGGTHTFTVSGTVSAAQVEDIAVVISQ